MRALVLAVAWVGIARGQEPPADVPVVRTPVRDGVWIDWTRMVLEGEATARGFGVGADPKAVEQLARRELGPGFLAGVDQVRITEDQRIADLAADPALLEAVRSRVSRWVETETRYHTSGKVGLTGELSLQDLLKPWLLARSVPAPEGEAGVYTGLLIDARGIAVTPAFAPRLLDGEGAVLWVPVLWEEHALTEVPVVWVAEPSHPAAARAGLTPLMLRAERSKGTDLVLPAEDAARFRAEMAGSRELGEGTVVVVVDP